MKIYFSFLFTFLVSLSYGQDAEKLYNEGKQYKKDKKSLLALESFRKATVLKKNYTEALYEMGWCYNDLKRYKDAILTLREARKSWNDVPKVFFELGYAFKNDNQYDSAKAAFVKCADLKPDYKGLYKQMAYLEYDKDKYSEALTFFNKELSYLPDGGKDYLIWYRKGFSENAMKLYDKALLSLQNSLLYKQDYINTYLEIGFAKTKLKNDNPGAIGYFKQAMQIDSKSHIPYNGIGEIYRDNIKNCDSAMFWYRKSLEVKPKERKACFGIAYCFNTKSQYFEAIPYLKTAIEQEPNYTAAFVELGYAYFKLKQFTDAETNLNKAILIAKDNHNAHYYLCVQYIEQKRKADALKMLSELKRLNSKYVSDLDAKIQKL